MCGMLWQIFHYYCFSVYCFLFTVFTLLAGRVKQGVALTGRNTTGPPRDAPWRVTLHMRAL